MRCEGSRKPDLKHAATPGTLKKSFVASRSKSMRQHEKWLSVSSGLFEHAKKAGKCFITQTSLRALQLFVSEPNKAEVKSSLENSMATAALLAGFATGMSLSVSDEEIERYATFVKTEYFGRDSHLCTWVQQHVWKSHIPELPNPMGVVNGSLCDPESRCWRGHQPTLEASERFGFETCSLTIGDLQTNCAPCTTAEGFRPRPYRRSREGSVLNPCALPPRSQTRRTSGA